MIWLIWGYHGCMVEKMGQTPLIDPSFHIKHAGSCGFSSP